MSGIARRPGGSTSSPLATAAASVVVCVAIHLALSAALPTPPPTSALAQDATPPPGTVAAATTSGKQPFPANAKVFRSEDPVVPFQPYRPTHKGWSKRIYPSGPGKKDGRSTDCVAWRQTASCRPDGPREAFFDLPCDAKVPSGKSGYCQCGDNSKKGIARCNQYRPFTCNEACAKNAETSDGAAGSSGNDDADAHPLIARPHEVDEAIARDGHAVVDGHKVSPYHASEDQVKAVRAKLESAANDEDGTAAKKRRGAAPRRLAEQPMPESVSEPHCHSFQQTRGCDPHGPPAGNHRGCEDIVPAGISGYCVCGNGYVGPGVGCDHPPFTCHDGCDPTMAKEMDEVLGKHLPPPPPQVLEGGALQEGTENAAVTDSQIREAVAKVATAHYERQLTDGDGSRPLRVLDHVKLTAEDEREVAAMKDAARRRAAEIRAVDDARRKGDLGPTKRFVAGGGPAILEHYAAYDADVAHQLEQAMEHANKQGPGAQRPLAEGAETSDGDDSVADGGDDAPSGSGADEGDVGGDLDPHAAVELADQARKVASEKARNNAVGFPLGPKE